jgi:hypothetical protein
MQTSYARLLKDVSDPNSHRNIQGGCRVKRVVQADAFDDEEGMPPTAEGKVLFHPEITAHACLSLAAEANIA